MAEKEPLRWSGWELRGDLLVTPRRVRLVPNEAKLLRILMSEQLSYKPASGRPAPLIPAHDLKFRGGFANLNALRIWISKLRSAVGEDAVPVVKNRGYRLLPCDGSRGPRPAVDELVESLGRALAAAKRLKKSMREGL